MVGNKFLLLMVIEAAASCGIEITSYWDFGGAHKEKLFSNWRCCIEFGPDSCDCIRSTSNAYSWFLLCSVPGRILLV